LRVRETTKQAAEASRKIVDEELSVVADKLNERNRVAIETAVDEQVKALDVAMREAFGRNLTLAADVEERIEAQLKLVGEMATNLEQRVNEAHSSFAGIDDEGFARRMALLTESLNSAAIDVAKILSNEVTDTAWAAYLKGDRGVFTRRAVRLLDSGEAKIIAAHYDDDAEFREHVNRYIHDFESMMRVLLSTRDGNAIGVTLLSSDVGKLYVALAQAIERLRG
jgi:predicted transcriptional regulator